MHPTPALLTPSPYFLAVESSTAAPPFYSFQHPCSPSPCLSHRNAFQNILSSNWLQPAPAAPVRLKLPLPACHVIPSDQLALSPYVYFAPTVSAFPHTSIPISRPVTSEAPSPLSGRANLTFLQQVELHSSFMDRVERSEVREEACMHAPRRTRPLAEEDTQERRCYFRTLSTKHGKTSASG